MKTVQPVTVLLVCLLFVACGTDHGAASSPSAATTSPSMTALAELPTTPVESGEAPIVLRSAPPDLACDSIGWEGEPYRTLAFHVDADAAEQVWAVSDTGAALVAYWSVGFAPGTRDEGLVRDPGGAVFVRDGDVVPVPVAANLRINGYLVCLRPDRLYVLTAERG